MTNDSKEVAEHFERVLLGAGMTATLGWASHPQDGEDPISLYRAANDRLSARQTLPRTRIDRRETTEADEVSAGVSRTSVRLFHGRLCRANDVDGHGHRVAGAECRGCD